MKGLLVKDLLLLKMQKSFIILAFVICAFMAFSDSDSMFPITFLTFVLSLFSVSTISYDEFENGNPFLFADQPPAVCDRKILLCPNLGNGSRFVGGPSVYGSGSGERKSFLLQQFVSGTDGIASFDPDLTGIDHSVSAEVRRRAGKDRHHSRDRYFLRGGNFAGSHPTVCRLSDDDVRQYQPAEHDRIFRSFLYSGRAAVSGFRRRFDAYHGPKRILKQGTGQPVLFVFIRSLFSFQLCYNESIWEE